MAVPVAIAEVSELARPLPGTVIFETAARLDAPVAEPKPEAMAFPLPFVVTEALAVPALALICPAMPNADADADDVAVPTLILEPTDMAAAAPVDVPELNLIVLPEAADVPRALAVPTLPELTADPTAVAVAAPDAVATPDV